MLAGVLVSVPNSTTAVSKLTPNDTRRIGTLVSTSTARLFPPTCTAVPAKLVLSGPTLHRSATLGTGVLVGVLVAVLVAVCVGVSVASDPLTTWLVPLT